MPLPFILGGLVLAAAGYGFKKSIDASKNADKINEIVKEAEDLKEGAKNRVESAQSGCKNALMRLGEKKFHVISRGVSRFVEHFNQLKGHQFFVKASDMQDLHKQVSVAQNFSKQLNASGMGEESAIGGMFASYGGLYVSGWTTGAMLGGGLTMGGLVGMAVLGGLVAGPALAILGAVSADEMEEKLEKAKAYHSQVEEAVKKADAIIDQFQAIEKMAKLFTRQITKCDALFFSLSRCHRHDEKTQLQSLPLQPRRKRSALRCGFNPHDFERFFESPHHRQTPKAPREGAKGFGDHEKADGCSRKRAL
ncbi:hypothetical protein [Helicobacter pylori]|uniref:hypothetical protein n=1 Tax=Helicobacter pylori TaxID=210 RepID=UPI00026A817D|nr:hypothetical protein [Helicobacter pylori]EJB24902.1 proteobacterial sortase system OmpA family protein [Helicobacter pylori CPY6311]